LPVRNILCRPLMFQYVSGRTGLLSEVMPFKRRAPQGEESEGASAPLRRRVSGTSAPAAAPAEENDEDEDEYSAGSEHAEDEGTPPSLRQFERVGLTSGRRSSRARGDKVPMHVQPRNA
jgi:hypothetical protein